jgi:hypothetical protein
LGAGAAGFLALQPSFMKTADDRPQFSSSCSVLYDRDALIRLHATRRVLYLVTIDISSMIRDTLIKFRSLGQKMSILKVSDAHII